MNLYEIRRGQTFRAKLFAHKKVLLRERKRHIACHVASPGGGGGTYLGWGGGCWGISTLVRGYLPWLGEGGYLPWLGWGTPPPPGVDRLKT